jgi:hypothetical protein
MNMILASIEAAIFIITTTKLYIQNTKIILRRPPHNNLKIAQFRMGLNLIYSCFCKKNI